MKIREVLDWLRRDGWVVVRVKGSHRQLRHPMKSGLVTVAGHPNDDLAPGTLRSILTQADLEER
jgi:predicted RNA binding protein YcfA (HicA-like mRNA interferase family)